MKKVKQIPTMLRLRFFSAALLMVPVVLSLKAQNYFELTFGNPGNQYERFNAGTYFQGDLVGAGYATTPSGAYIVRVNSSTGQYMWQVRLGDGTQANSIENTSDGNMILGGTKSTGSNSSKMALIKINGNGGWIWTKTFGGNFQYQCEKAIQTSDGGYALFGTSQLDLMNQFSSGRLYLLKTNSAGDSLWAKTYGVPAGWQRGNDIIELSGGGYALCGASYNAVSGTGGSIVIRTDANGDTLWTRTLGVGHDGAKKLVQSGNYIFVLNQLSMNSQGQILAFDMNGNHTVFSNLSNNVGVGGFVRNMGGSFSVALSDYNSNNVKIYNVNTSGTPQLIRTFNGDYRLTANSLITTWINQLAVFGRDYNYQVGVEDAWVASLDTLGNVQQISNNCSVEIGVNDTTVCQGSFVPNPMVTGTGPFTYYWTPPIGMNNPNIANPVITNVFHQLYTLIVTDATGCTATDNVYVTSYTASSDSVFLCNNGTATLDLGPGSTYQWLNFQDTLGNFTQMNQTTQTITVNQPGTYTALEYTQGCGVLTSQFFVGTCQQSCANAWNLFNYIHNPFCGGDSILFVSTGGPSPLATWLWYASPQIFGNSSTAWLVLTNNNPQWVELYTTDINGCQVSTSMLITPQIGASLNVSAGPDTVVCNGSYTTTAQATGGSGNYTFLWEPQSYFSNPNLPTQTFSNVHNQTFWVWVTDGSGCTTLDTLVITALNTQPIPQTVHLCGGNATLSMVSGASYYQWFNGFQTQAITVSDTGLYYGYGYYQGCGTVVQQFHVVPCTTNCFLSAGYQHNPWACGDSVFFYGTMGTQVASVFWDFGDGHTATSSSLSIYHYYQPQPGTTYTVTIIAVTTQGCTATTTLQILIQGGYPVTAFAGNDQTYCFPGTYQLNATASGGTAPYFFQWYPPSGLNDNSIHNPIVNLQGAMTYLLVVTDANGCQDFDTLNLDIVQGGINDTIYLCGSTVELCMQDNSPQYIWNPGGAQTQCITVSDTGTYFGISWPNNCQTTPNYFHVLPCPVSCWSAFTYTSNISACGDSVFFIATSSIPANQFSWNFGDGTILNSVMSTTYHYFSAGTYTVTLTVTDAQGCTSVSSQVVSVNHGFSVSAGDDIVACQSNIQLHAQPSVPGNYFYQWHPPTGLNNAFIQSPVASQVHNQQYIVTVTNVNTGCQASDTVIVSAYNWSGGDTLEACGDSVLLDFGAGAQFYNWQYFIDVNGTTHYLNHYGQTLNVLHPGQYFGYAIFPNCGALTSIFTVVPCQGDSVWPGDANADGQAHNLDLLTIGIGYGTSGFIRPNATINWQAEASPAWGLQLQSGVDYKHIDCNGDGVINVDDTLAVIQNYGLLHSLGGVDELTGSDDPMLYLTALSDTVLTGSPVVVAVKLGTEIVPANDVYGIAFTIQYNQELVQANTMGINFSNSWFGVHGLNMISIRKNFHGFGWLDVALTRVDHQNISGYGTIGELHFITIDNLSGKQTLYETLELEISNVRLIRNDESEVDLGIQNDSIIVTDLDNAIHQLSSMEAAISVFPNPAKDLLTLSIAQKNGTANMKFEILNAMGELIVPAMNIQQAVSTVNISGLASGVYFLRVSGENGMVNKKFTVAK